MTGPIQIALSPVRQTLVWKRRVMLTAFALTGALAVMAFRLMEYSAYLAQAARV